MIKKQLRDMLDIARRSLTDDVAVKTILLFGRWHEGVEYIKNDRIRHNGKLYRVRQNHTSQANLEPGAVGTESLYVRIDETHAGTLEEPIPYEGNMELEQGKYYSQAGVTYLCTRNTDIPVFNTLAELVGIYVEVAYD